MRWRVHSRRVIYESGWVNLYVDDVELPDGHHVAHHVLDMPRRSVGAIVVDHQGRTLLVWRHRFITDKWGWEVPAGWVDPGEDPEFAVRREIEEETGWRPGLVERLIEYHPLSGLSSMHYTVFLASDAERISEPPDSNEISRVEWVPLADIPMMAAKGQIADGPSLLILGYYLGVHRNLAGGIDLTS
jgi:8-oxo-dGTP pyrophosphatase MutT (NUDIX family)